MLCSCVWKLADLKQNSPGQNELHILCSLRLTSVAESLLRPAPAYAVNGVVNSIDIGKCDLIVYSSDAASQKMLKEASLLLSRHGSTGVGSTIVTECPKRPQAGSGESVEQVPLSLPLNTRCY